MLGLILQISFLKPFQIDIQIVVTFVAMYIKIRNAGSGETVMINNLSKLDNIGKVKQLVTEK